MSQEYSLVGPNIGPIMYAKNTVVIPATGDTDLLEMQTLGLKTLGAVILPTVNNLDAFKVLMKFHPDDVFHAIYTAVTSTPGGLVLAASGTLASLTADATGWIILDVRGIYAVKFTASGSVNDITSVTVRASGSR